MVVLANDLYDGAFIENKCWSVVFKDSPYETLNNVKLDVTNIQADNEVSGFCGPKLKITFDAVFRSDFNGYNSLKSWFHNMYSPCMSNGINRVFRARCVEDATLYLYDGDNGKLLRKFNLYNVYQIEYTDELRQDYIKMSFRATPISVEDLTEEEKKMNDGKELSIILKKAQPYVELISLLDKVEERIGKHGLPSSFESVGKEFAESLNRYNNLLKDSCIGIMKDAYK